MHSTLWNQLGETEYFLCFMKNSPSSPAQPRKGPLVPALTVVYSDLLTLSPLHGLLLAQKPPCKVHRS
jgi:hypothetical protein